MSKRAKPLERKVLIGLFSAVMVVVVATHVLLQHALTSFSVESTRIELARDAHLVRAELAPIEGRGDAALHARLVQLASVLNLRITLIGPEGHVIADSSLASGAPVASHADRPERLEALRDGLGVDVRESDTLRRDMVYVALPIGDPPGPRGVVRVSRDMSELELLVRDLRGLLYWIASGSLLGAFFFSLLMARWLARPLRQFATYAREIAAGERAPQALDRFDHSLELHDLAVAVNAMIAEHARVRRRLRHDSPQLSALLSALDCPVLVTNPAGQIIRTNDAAREQLTLVYTVRDLDEAGLGALAEVIAQAIESGAPVGARVHDERALRKESHPRVYLAMIVPMTALGVYQGAVIVLDPVDLDDALASDDAPVAEEDAPDEGDEAPSPADPKTLSEAA